MSSNTNAVGYAERLDLMRKIGVDARMWLGRLRRSFVEDDIQCSDRPKITIGIALDAVTEALKAAEIENLDQRLIKVEREADELRKKRDAMIDE